MVEEHAQLGVVDGAREGLDAVAQLLEAGHAGEAGADVERDRLEGDRDAARDGAAEPFRDVGRGEPAAPLRVLALQADPEDVEEGLADRDVGVVAPEVAL